MKQPEYREGPEAQQSFEEGMKALFNVSKDSVVPAEKKEGNGGLLPASGVYENGVVPAGTRSGDE